MGALNASEEQLAIASAVIAPGNLYLVDAYAGAGKTTTLIHLAQSHPTKRILYIVFGHKNAEEAREKMPSNVEVFTGHGLALKRYGHRYQAAGKLDRKRNLTASDIRRRFNCSGEDAKAIRGTLTNWLNTIDPEITLDHIQQYDGSLFEREEKILPFAKKLLVAMRDLSDKDTIADENLYLKEWVLSHPALEGYDLIMVDEAQDSNALIVDLVMRNFDAGRAAVMFVGDRHQNIFEFRKTVNVMEVFSPRATKRFRLTTSYRYTPQIAGFATKILSTFKGEGGMVSGKAPAPLESWFPDMIRKNREWREAGGKGKAPEHSRFPTTCILARTNATLLTVAIAMLKKNPAKRFHFAGTKEAEQWSPRGAYHFAELEEASALYDAPPGRPPKMATKLMRDATSWAEFEAEAKDSPDPEARYVVQLIKRYGNWNLPGLLRAVELAASASGAALTLSTAHRSKGLEWDKVVILGDFPFIIGHEPEIPGGMEKKAFEQEANLLYVAITRARKEVVMSHEGYADWLGLPPPERRNR